MGDIKTFSELFKTYSKGESLLIKVLSKKQTNEKFIKEILELDDIDINKQIGIYETIYSLICMTTAYGLKIIQTFIKYKPNRQSVSFALKGLSEELHDLTHNYGYIDFWMKTNYLCKLEYDFIIDKYSNYFLDHYKKNDLENFKYHHPEDYDTYKKLKLKNKYNI